MKFKKTFFSFLFVLLSLFLVSCKDKNTESTKYTDELKLETAYEGKVFLNDGIGAVTLLQPVDGDTAHFKDAQGRTIKVRFLGINTPESTGQIAPWGFQASEFTKGKLKNAVEIVLEADEVGKAPEIDATGERYLAYVWYRPSQEADFRNLNIEIIEMSYSLFTDYEAGLKYGDQFMKAYRAAYARQERVNGYNKDPNFDYSGEIRNITIAELRNNFSSYSTGTILFVTVRVVRLVGNSLYVEDLEASFNEATGKTAKAGIFLYHSFVGALGQYTPGDVISLKCQASNTETYGFQLVNPSELRTIERNTALDIAVIPDDVTSLREYEGLVVQINEFTVTGIGNQNSETQAYTIFGTMKNGTEIQVRIDGDCSPKLSYSIPQEGVTYKVIGGVSKYVDIYDDYKIIYQIKLGNQKGVGVYDFLQVNN